MLNTKVLTAVLVSLAATSIAANGGTSMSIGDNIGLNSLEDLEISTKSLGAFTGLIERSETDTPVRVQVKFNKSLPQKLSLSSASFEARNLTSITAGERRIDSDESISFYGFEGTITLSRPVVVDGRADGVVSSGVNVSGSFDIKQQVSTDKLVMRDIGSASLTLESAHGRISSGSISTRISGDKLSINSFSGNMSINLGTKSLNMSGEVGSLTAGSFSLGG